MKFLFTLLFFSVFCSCAQQTGQPITFREIGWTINLPEGFELLDSSTIASRIAKGKQASESSSNVRLEESGRELLIVAKKGSNTFISSITPFNEEVDGSWQVSNQHIREMIFQTLTIQKPSVQFDSSRTLELIDSVSFSKFIMTGKENGKVIFNAVNLSKLYEGYDFEINYIYVDENIGTQMEEMLKQSKFSK